MEGLLRELLRKEVRIMLLEQELIELLREQRRRELPEELILLPELLREHEGGLLAELEQELGREHELEPILLPGLLDILPRGEQLIGLLPGEQLEEQGLATELLD